MKRIMCIWFPNWPIQRIVAARPELRRRPVVLFSEDGRRGKRVFACSKLALEYGVRSDMPLAEAQSLIRTKYVHHCHVEEYNPRADRQQLEALAERCERFSPYVGVESAEHPESLLLSVAGLEHLFGGEYALAELALRELRTQYTPRIAIADGIGAAWAISHFATSSITVCAQGDISALAKLPVRALRLADDVAPLLARLGIERIEQLLRLPRASISERFGDVVLVRLDQATGAVEEPMVTHRADPELQATWSLEHPTAHRGTIEKIAACVTERLGAQLASLDRGAVQIEFSLVCESGDTIRIGIGLFEPTSNAEHLTELIAMQFEHVALPGAVRRVCVQVTASAALVSRQGELFLNGTMTDANTLALLVDRLSSRLGADKVLRPERRATAQPERAFRYQPLTDPLRQGPAQSIANGKKIGPLQRPLHMRCPPLPIQVLAAVPDGPPASFHFSGSQHRVATSWGPETIETGWWRGQSVRRDYYRVETDHGYRFWLFRRIRDGAWFLHGEFD